MHLWSPSLSISFVIAVLLFRPYSCIQVVEFRPYNHDAVFFLASHLYSIIFKASCVTLSHWAFRKTNQKIPHSDMPE